MIMKDTNSFITELHSVMPNPFARLKLVALLAKYAGQTIYIPTESKQDRRIRAAGNMLANGMCSAEIAGAIVTRFNVSKRTAERDVISARNLSANSVASSA